MHLQISICRFINFIGFITLTLKNTFITSYILRYYGRISLTVITIYYWNSQMTNILYIPCIILSRVWFKRRWNYIFKLDSCGIAIHTVHVFPGSPFTDSMINVASFVTAEDSRTAAATTAARTIKVILDIFLLIEVRLYAVLRL